MARIEAPSPAELKILLGDSYSVWEKLVQIIEENYLMEMLWSTGGKAAPYERKYRRGGKTLCALYPRKGEVGFLVVLGIKEQEKFEAAAESFSPAVQQLYCDTKTYHDGRWLMLWMRDDSLLADAARLLPIKRRPNRS